MLFYHDGVKAAERMLALSAALAMVDRSSHHGRAIDRASDF